MRQANDAGRSIEDALAGFCFVWMLTCLLDGAFLVMGQSAYVFGPIKHTSALTAWPAPIDVSLYLIHCSGQWGPSSPQSGAPEAGGLRGAGSLGGLLPAG